MQETKKLTVALAKLSYQKLMLEQNKDNSSKPIIGMIEKRIEMVNKGILARSEFLRKKDPKLHSMYFELVQSNLDNLIS